MNPGQVCQFCAAPAKIEGTCARNPVQAVFSCKLTDGIRRLAAVLGADLDTRGVP